MNLGEFIKIRKKELGISTDFIANALGTHRSNVFRWEREGAEKIAGKYLEPLADVLQCSLEDIIFVTLGSSNYTQKNGNFLDFPTTHQEQTHIKKYRACDERGKGMVDTVLGYEYNRTVDLLNKNDNERSEPTVTIQVPYESMAAGFGNYLSDSSYEKIDFPVSKVPNGTDYGVRISGDSMNPTIPDGCIAFVRCRPAIENGKIGLFSLNGEGYCKRLEVDSENRTISLVSDNDKYKPIKVGAEDYLHTYGEVLGWAEI
ncbi:MAG: hypothetical protein FWE04_00870 [Oscillospiraceae bacterium]|nr:hypothetical protein [Oscillospiraceae bacterium]